MENIIILCIIGGVAGWLAGVIVRLNTDSRLVDIIIGIIGSYLATQLFGKKLYMTHNIWADKIITATVGAVILAIAIKVIRMIFKR